MKFLRNDVSTSSRSVTLQLTGTTANRDGIGARVSVTTRGNDDAPHTSVQTLRAGDSFLSQCSKRLVFGIPKGQKIEKVEVHWPGQRSAESFTDVEAEGRYALVEGAGQAERIEVEPRDLGLEPSVQEPFVMSERARVVRYFREPAPEVSYVDFKGRLRKLKDLHQGEPMLINLWASWCGPCVEELATFKKHHDQLKEKGLQVVGLSTDAVTEDGEKPDIEPAKQLVKRENFPFEVGVVDATGVRLLTLAHHAAISRERPLPLPSSFLVDAKGRIAVIYKGPVTVEQLLEDAALATMDLEVAREKVFPFPSRDGQDLFELTPLRFAQAFQAGSHLEDARRAIRGYIATLEERRGDGAASSAELKARYFLGTLEQSERQWGAAAEVYEGLQTVSPDQLSVRVPLGVVLWQLDRREEAEQHFAEVAKGAAESAGLLEVLAKAQLQIGRPDQAVLYFKQALAVKPGDASLLSSLAAAELQTQTPEKGIARYETILETNPSSLGTKNRLAWIYATHTNAQLRDADKALAFAEEIAGATNHENFTILDTLAAALANAGKFDAAIGHVTRALDLATAAGDPRSSRCKGLRERLASYKEGVPWRQ